MTWTPWPNFFIFPLNICVVGHDETFSTMPPCFLSTMLSLFMSISSYDLLWVRVGMSFWPAARWSAQLSSAWRGKDWTLFCVTFLKAFPGQRWFGRSVHLGCWAAASHLVLKLEWVGSCQRLDWEIWMQAGNPSNGSSQIGTVGKTLENHNYFKQNTKFVSFLNIM